jgi:trimeric autotransporter adhesin
MTPKKQVSPAIRILRGERDASARATHLEAATRKFLVTTNERKQMSTKTNFKRIALVAVASLGLGVLSSVPSQAAITGLTVTTVDGTATLALADSTTAATVTIAGIMETTDSMTVELVQMSAPAAGANHKVFWINLDSNTPQMATAQTLTDTQAIATNPALAHVSSAVLQRLPVAATGTTSETAVAITSGAGTMKIRYTSLATAGQSVSQKLGIQLDSATARTAGTYTYTVVVKAYNKGATGEALFTTPQPTQTITKTVNIVVAAATSASTVASSVYGFAFMSNTTTSKNDGIANQGDSSISVVATADGSTVGYVYVGVRNASNVSGTAVESLTAVVTGAGSVCTEGGVCGTNITVAAASDYQFLLRANGTAGLSTVTITTKVTGQTYTKTLNYFAKAAKTITATVAHPNLKIGTNTGAVRVTAVDATGVNWTGAFYIVASAAADALVGGSATTPVACGGYDATVGYASCDISTLTTGTAKFKVIDAATVALATATSNEVTTTVINSIPATVKLSFDKTSYAPNERARIYVTPLDAAGKEMQTVTVDNLLAAGGITVNGAISFTGTTTTADSLTATSITTSASSSSTTGAKAGSRVLTVYMPAAGGTVTISATGGTGLSSIAGRVAVTASATVTDSGAAALAAVTALATTVASLKTLITTLTNLVLKIQKKVKA